MAIPSEGDLSEYISLLKRACRNNLSIPSYYESFGMFLSIGFLEKISEPNEFELLVNDLTIQNIEAFLGRVHDDIEESDLIRAKHPVQIWLNNQSGFNSATGEKFNGRLKELNKTRWIEEYKVKVLSILDFDEKSGKIEFHSEGQLDSLHSLITLDMHYNDHDWLWDVVEYLTTYYYDPDYWKVAYLKNNLSDMKKEKEALISVNNLIDYLYDTGPTIFNRRVRNKSIVTNVLEDLKEDLKIQLFCLDEKFIPIERSGKGAKERWLIYHLWHRCKTTGERGVAIIRRLLAIEGIDAEYDDRALHNMIAKWEKQLDDRAVRYKHLDHHFSSEDLN